MENVSLKHSAIEMVNVYIGDELTEQVTRAKARDLKAAGTHFFINHGRDLRMAKELVLQTQIEKMMGWQIPFELRNTALNRGRRGQFSLGYPIPYVFEGHIKPMRVAVINAGDPLHA